MAVHESQSLFWENRVARSAPFAERWWQRFRSEGAPLDSAAHLWQAMNPVAPGTNRVESDELSYGLHIMIRTDLELALLEQGLPVEDLPTEWNRRYRELLGVVPANDAEGVSRMCTGARGCLAVPLVSAGASGQRPTQ